MSARMKRLLGRIGLEGAAEKRATPGVSISVADLRRSFTVHPDLSLCRLGCRGCPGRAAIEMARC
jgi:hypothetical protein